MADFLVMDELLVELHKRFLERAPSVLSAASFNPENMSKYQIWTLMGHDHDKYFKLRLVLEWLKGSTSENRNAMKLWFEDKLGRSWVSLIQTSNSTFAEFSMFFEQHATCLNDFLLLRRLCR